MVSHEHLWGGGGGGGGGVAPIFGEEWQEVEGGSGPGLGDVGSNQLRSSLHQLRSIYRHLQ